MSSEASSMSVFDASIPGRGGSRLVPEILACALAPYEVRTISRGRGEDRGADVFLRKFIRSPRSRFIDAVISQSRSIPVIRDGRAVANPLLRVTWWWGYGGLSWSGWEVSPDRDQHSSEGAVAPSRHVPPEWKMRMDAAREPDPSIERLDSGVAMARITSTPHEDLEAQADAE